eukprot:m.411560 g.411560  ORF g.411560 m.411560 type:complete len:647 (-) comp28691_c0_seq1:200-2140(-)
MVEHYIPPAPALAEVEGPLLYLHVRNTANLKHNWNHAAFGGSGSGQSGTPKYFVVPAGQPPLFEIAVEARSLTSDGPLVNDRIKRCTFSLPAVCNPSTAHATAAPFHTRNRAPTNAAAFTATVTVVLTDIHGVERVVVLTHDTAVSKQVCTTVYEALESVVAQPNAPQHVWTKVNYGNCYVPHSDVGSDVQPLLAPEGSGLGPALSLGVVEENLGEIGRGSFGAVFKGRTAPDSGLPSFVAVKQLLSTQDEDQFWVEAKTAASVPSHDNVVSFLGWGEVFGKLSLVFEFCEEKDLHSYMKKNSDPLTKQHTLSPAVIVDLCKQIAAGMAFIHESRHFHRDLKPNNILLTRKGAVGPSGLRAVITDLGSAKNIATEVNLSQSVLGSQVGTLIYMAPETIAKSVFSQGTEIWSYAAVVWQLLVGQAPYSYLGSYNPVGVAFQVGFGHLSPEQLSWPAPFDTIMPQAFTEDHHKRPTFTDIYAVLSGEGGASFAATGIESFRLLQQNWAQHLQQKFGARQPRPAPLSEMPSPTSVTVAASLKSNDSGNTGSPKTFTTELFSTVGGAVPQSPLTDQVLSLVNHNYDHIVAEYGFDTLDDFELYSEEDLVVMGFKKVHARKLRRAAESFSKSPPPMQPSPFEQPPSAAVEV